jgi:hypothetical protein
MISTKVFALNLMTRRDENSNQVCCAKSGLSALIKLILLGFNAPYEVDVKTEGLCQNQSKSMFIK